MSSVSTLSSLPQVREENHHKQSQRLREGWKASGKGLGHGIKQYTKPVHLVRGVPPRFYILCYQGLPRPPPCMI